MKEARLFNYNNTNTDSINVNIIFRTLAMFIECIGLITSTLTNQGHFMTKRFSWGSQGPKVRRDFRIMVMVLDVLVKYIFRMMKRGDNNGIGLKIL